MNLKTRILWGFIVPLLCCCWGCEDKAADDTINLSATTLFFESKAEAQSVNVTSSATCHFSRVDEVQNWCMPNYDISSGVVSILVAENPDYSARNTVIRVEAGNCIKEIDVIQQGRKGKLALTNAVLEVFDKNQTAVVGLETADAWKVSVSGNWLTAVPESGTGNQIVRFNFSENTMDAPRTATITFSIPNETKTFVLTQGAKLPDDRMHDSLALVALYNSAEGDNWPMKDNWLSGAPINQWAGVYLNNEGRVKSLYVVGEEPFMSESSRIPEEIKYLTNLEAFMLTNSGIGGKLPEGLFRCLALKSIGYGGKVNGASGHLTGEIPLLIGCLSNLAELDLSRNQLEGGIPAEISGCPLNLNFDLSYNKLTKLPTLLQATPMDANFSYNLFSGVVPQEWGGWFNPGRFTLMGNKDLGGELPAIWCEQGRAVIILETSIIPCNK